MATELDLLKVLSNDVRYSKWAKYAKKHVLSEQSVQITNDLPSYFDKFKGNVNWSDFSTWFRTIKHPNWKPEKHGEYAGIFERLGKHTPSIMYSEVINKYIEMDYATQIMDHTRSIMEGTAESGIEVVSELMQNYLDCIGVDEDGNDKASMAIKDILKTLSIEDGYEFKLPDLRRMIGVLHQKGSLVTVFGPPNSGKTTFAIGECCYMASQLEDAKVVVFNNEEEDDLVRMRAYQCVLGASQEQIEQYPERAEAKFIEKMGSLDAFQVIGNADSVSFIEAKCAELKPDFIILNVLDKVSGFKNAGKEVERIRSLYQWGRRLSRDYGPVWVVAQGMIPTKQNGEPQRSYLRKEDVYGSKVGASGESDHMIGLVAPVEDHLQDRRKMSVAKCKRQVGPLVDRALFEGNRDIKFDAVAGQFSSFAYPND